MYLNGYFVTEIHTTDRGHMHTSCFRRLELFTYPRNDLLHHEMVDPLVHNRTALVVHETCPLYRKDTNGEPCQQ